MFVLYVHRIVSTEESVNRFVRSYDPNAQDGYGEVELTADKLKAKQFSDSTSAFEFWRQQSTVRPLREDGEPNRPLTAYTVEIVRMP